MKYRRIPLSQNKYAMVDDDVFDQTPIGQTKVFSGTKKVGRFLSEQVALRACIRADEGLFVSFAAVNSI